MIYALLFDTNPALLVVSINVLLAQGWAPHGSPFVRGNVIFQAMIKSTST